MSDWTHNSLQADLAAHLAGRSERMIWEDMQLGPAGSVRPDVFTMRKSYTSPKPLAYEVKVSIADFRRDITSGKWQSYLKYACGVTFAAPRGLITKGDLPKGCGLVIRGESGWHTIKAPTLHPVQLSQSFMLKLVIDGVHRERSVASNRAREIYWPTQHARKQLSEDVVSAVRDLQGAQDRAKQLIYSASYEAERIRSHAREAAERANDRAGDEIVRLCRVLGLDPQKSTPDDVVNAARDFRAGLAQGETIKHALRSVQFAQNSVKAAYEQLEKLIVE